MTLPLISGSYRHLSYLHRAPQLALEMLAWMPDDRKAGPLLRRLQSSPRVEEWRHVVRRGRDDGQMERRCALAGFADLIMIIILFIGCQC